MQFKAQFLFFSKAISGNGDMRDGKFALLGAEKRQCFEPLRNNLSHTLPFPSLLAACKLPNLHEIKPWLRACKKKGHTRKSLSHPHSSSAFQGQGFFQLLSLQRALLLPFSSLAEIHLLSLKSKCVASRCDDLKSRKKERKTVAGKRGEGRETFLCCFLTN